MFTSIMSFINSRLRTDAVMDDFTNQYGYFIKVHPKNFYSMMFFLKNDPDMRLALLDQIIAIPIPAGPWTKPKSDEVIGEILYQFQSLKLPYRVTVVLEILADSQIIPSLAPLYNGARWQEEDICNKYNLTIEEGSYNK